MKKYGLFLAVLVVLSGAAFAEGSKDAAAAGPTEVSVFWRAEKFPIAEDNPILKVIQDKTNVKLKYLNIPWNAYVDKLNLQIAAGDLPDIIMNMGRNDMNAQNWVSQGVFAPLDTLLAKAPNITKAIPKELFNKMKMPDGKTYFIPRLWKASHVFLVRDDLMAKYSLKVPTTLTEFLDTGRKLKAGLEKDGVKNVYPYGGFNLLFWTRWISAAYGLPHGTYKKVNGEYVFASTTPQAKEWVQYIKGMYDEGILDPDMVVFKASEGREKFYQGRIAMAGMRIDDAFRANDMFKNANLSASVGIYPPPKSDKGVGGYFHIGNMTDSKGVGVWMSASLGITSKKQEASIKALDYLISPEGTELGFWGREGVEYKKTSPTDYAWNVGIEEREKLGLPMVLNIVLGKPEYAESLDNPYTPAMQKAWSAIENGTYSDYLEPVPYNQKMREILTTMGTYVDENLTNFIIGKRPMSEFDAYIQEWQRRGGTELLKELNAEAKRLGL